MLGNAYLKLGGILLPLRHYYHAYRKVKWVTIPIRNSSKITHIFMVSFDVEVDHEPIILNGIIPELGNLVL